MRSSTFSSMLGLALDKEGIKAASLHRANGGIEIRQSFESALPLDLMTRDPERFGREIRNHLDDAGIQERRCVVCIPLAWAYTLRTEVPPLPEKDVESYLNVQAEREFPFAPENLTVAVSRYRTSDGAGWATLVGVPSTRLAALRQALKAARLRPLSITFGITSLMKEGPGAEEGRLVLFLGDGGIDLSIMLGGTLWTLRSLDATQNVETDAAQVARQIRITLGQFPEDIREKMGRVMIFGPDERAQPLLEGLNSLLGPLGMTVEPGQVPWEIQSPELGARSGFNPALLETTARRLRGQSTDFEFLKVAPSRFKHWPERISSRSTLWLGGVAAAIILGVGATLLFQYGRLAHLESEWRRIEPKVGELKVLQENVKRFRPWFNDSIPSLSVARMLTEAFPEEGTVWMRVLEIKGQSEVTCSGHARSNQEWLAMLDRLRETKGVEDLQVLQIRGENPLQFSLSFRWNKGYADES